jgi:hypothetical protein
MADRLEVKVGDEGGGGCAIILGLIIIACAIGSITDLAAYGWLAFGAGLLVLGILACVRR